MKTSVTLSLLSETERKSALDEVINFFKTERDEEIGLIAAENILEMFLEINGNNIYNKGLRDASEFMKKRFEETQVDIEVNLKK